MDAFIGFIAATPGWLFAHPRTAVAGAVVFVVLAGALGKLLHAGRDL